MSARVTAKAGLLDVLDRPLALTVELLWRWLFGFIALLLSALAALQAFAGVTVTDADQSNLLLSGDPRRAAETVLRIFAQAGPEVRHQLLWLAPTLLLLWFCASTLGRAAACSALLLRPRADWSELALRSFLKPVARLQAARALALGIAFAFAAIAERLSVWFAASRYVSVDHLLPDVAALVAVWCVIAVLWLTLNFLLSIAPATLLRHDLPPPPRPFLELLRRWRQNGNAWSGVTVRFLALKSLAAVTAFAASMAAAGMAAVFPFILCLALMLVIALAYFAVADTLFLARLSAFARLGGSGLGDEIYLRDR